MNLVIAKLPHITNNTIGEQEPDPGSSDIATVTKTGTEAGGVPLGNAKTSQEKKVVIAETTSTSALVKFHFHRSIPGIRMFQIQYNGSYDDSLVYRYAGGLACLSKNKTLIMMMTQRHSTAVAVLVLPLLLCS